MNEKRLCVAAECRDVSCSSHPKNNDILALKEKYEVRFVDFSKTCPDYIEPIGDDEDDQEYWG